MKKIYCKYCGLELERGSCKCEQFLNPNKKNVEENRICDTCGKKIDEDACFCPYCGIPQNINGNLKELQKELRGEKAIDVIEFYRKADLKKGIKKSKLRKSKLTVVISGLIVLSMLTITFFSFLYPTVRKLINDYKLRKELSNATVYDTPLIDRAEERQTEETTQPVLSLKEMWVRQDGFFYAFDKDGEPIVDDWVTAVDENGEEQKYYFDIDGKLVVNSWIDGEYYVGADGAMFKDRETPDGAYVDEDGKVLLQLGEGVPVTRETYVYYEHPGSTETVEASNMKSGLSGEIRGVNLEKKYELYVKSIRQEKETVTKDDMRCNITYYVPILDGADEREVKRANEAFEEVAKEFREALIQMAKNYRDFPKSIVFNVIEQRTLSSNRMNVLAHGKLTPRKGLTEKRKFRFVYDRKSKKVSMLDITE